MLPLSQSLAGRFTVVNLGAAGDRDFDLPDAIRATVTLLEIDAGERSRSSRRYYAQHKVRTVIAGSKGLRTFRQRRYGPCSSLFEPRKDLIEMYGLGKYYELVSASEVQCETLPDFLAGFGLPAVDFLKTDLEGADFEIIQSCGRLLDTMLAVQCELRFQPFYVGEPHFHQVAGYFNEHGFELVAMKPEFWKPRTAHARAHRDGRLVWADCLFMRSAATDSLDQAKQIVIASMLGRRSHAEYLAERFGSSLPEGWIAELKGLTEPRRRLRETWIWKALSKVKTVVRPSPFDLSHLAGR